MHFYSEITQLLLREGAIFDYDLDWDVNSLIETNNPTAAQKIILSTALETIQYISNKTKNFNINKLEKTERKVFYEHCLSELNNMKKSMIHRSTSYFDVLIDKNIVNYSLNHTVITDLKNNLIIKREMLNLI